MQTMQLSKTVAFTGVRAKARRRPSGLPRPQGRRSRLVSHPLPRQPGSRALARPSRQAVRQVTAMATKKAVAKKSVESVWRGSHPPAGCCAPRRRSSRPPPHAPPPAATA